MRRIWSLQFSIYCYLVITIFTYPFSSGSRYMPLKVQPKEMLVPLLVLRNPLFYRLSHYPWYYCPISQKTTLKLKEMEINFHALTYEYISSIYLTFAVFRWTINQFLKLLSFEEKKKTKKKKNWKLQRVLQEECRKAL